MTFSTFSKKQDNSSGIPDLKKGTVRSYIAEVSFIGLLQSLKVRMSSFLQVIVLNHLKGITAITVDGMKMIFVRLILTSRILIILTAIRCYCVRFFCWVRKTLSCCRLHRMLAPLLPVKLNVDWESGGNERVVFGFDITWQASGLLWVGQGAVLCFEFAKHIIVICYSVSRSELQPMAV